MHAISLENITSCILEMQKIVAIYLCGVEKNWNILGKITKQTANKQNWCSEIVYTVASLQIIYILMTFGGSVAVLVFVGNHLKDANLAF